MVDEQGRPLVVYHGAALSKNVDSIDIEYDLKKNKIGSRFNAGTR